MDRFATTGIDAAPPGAPPQALTVGVVVARIRQLVDSQFPSPVWIEGELSNVSYASSGHLYFNLVDEKVTDRRGQRVLLPCAFFFPLNQNLKFKLKDGLKVVCLGQVSTYEAKGQYQLRAQRMLPQGKGELQLAFEQLKQRLEAEGLFGDARKRPIPLMPSRVCVITSPTGSAVHDMVSKLRGWFQVTIVPAKVQGDGAANEIAEAIAIANRLNLGDVLIVGRGGGSVEDLWAFNEEPVARAIAGSRIPVISAVGHQDDWTIADYVADKRASTPTDAAKLLVHDQEVLAQQADDLVQQLVDGMRSVLDEQDGRLTTLHAQMRLLHPLNQVERFISRTQELDGQLVNRMRYQLDAADRSLSGLAGRLDALSPLAVLGRGYSITFAGARVVTDAAQVAPGDELTTRLSKGMIRSTVTTIEQQEPGAHGAH